MSDRDETGNKIKPQGSKCNFLKNSCRKFTGKVDHIVFRALNEHSTFLGRLQEKKLVSHLKLKSKFLLIFNCMCLHKFYIFFYLCSVW